MNVDYYEKTFASYGDTKVLPLNSIDDEKI